MGESSGAGAPFRYFLARDGGRPPRWIGPIQWTVLTAWLVFSWWLLLGGGRARISAAAYPINGIFADEVGLLSLALPMWGLVTLASAAFVLWSQAVWRRCRTTVAAEAGLWRWTGRKGPAAVEELAPTPGGAWCREGRRWHYVARGFVDDEGNDWLGGTGSPASQLLCARRLMSPLAVLLAIILVGAFLLEKPLRDYRRATKEVTDAAWGNDARRAESLVRAHPPFRPWLRYVSSIKACDQGECLRAQMADRLEMLSIGPEYGADSTSLHQLLVLAGRSALALKIFGPTGRAALDVAVRLDQPARARAILAANDKIRLDQGSAIYWTLLLEEGKIDEAYGLASKEGDPRNARALSLRAALAQLTGRCAEAERLARLLMAPDALDQARLEGEAPSTGLGALQRAARSIHVHSSYALGLAILAGPEEARKEWLKARALADAAGIPGALDMERVVLSRLMPGEAWLALGSPRASAGAAMPSRAPGRA